MEVSAWDVAAVGIKAILYAATLCAAGGVFFLLYSGALIATDQQRRIRRWVALCVAVAMAVSALRLAILAGSIGEGVGGLLDRALMRMVLQAGEARATGIRIAGLLLTGTVLLTAWRMLAPVGAVIAATSFALIGHAWAVRAGGLSIALLSLHLLGVAFWLGALVPLLLIARDADLARTAATAEQFGNVAVAVVLVLIVVGAALLWILLGTVSALWTSKYGRVVTLKLGLVAVLLSLAAFNKLHLTPRLKAGDPRAASLLTRSIHFELVLAVLILIVTAILTTLMGPPALL